MRLRGEIAKARGEYEEAAKILVRVLEMRKPSLRWKVEVARVIAETPQMPEEAHVFAKQFLKEFTGMIPTSKSLTTISKQPRTPD